MKSDKSKVKRGRPPEIIIPPVKATFEEVLKAVVTPVKSKS